MGSVLMATMAHSVEAFQTFDFPWSSSLTPTVTVTNYHKDAMPTSTYDGGRYRSTKHVFQSSMLTSASTSSTFLSAHSLTTALEGLWEDRIEDDSRDEKDDYKCLTWLDLESDLKYEDDRGGSSAADSDNQHDKQENEKVTLPLYPLSEVYLPMSTTAIAPNTIVNHTLNNVEPQNIKMALDLISEKSSSPRFCVVLRAIDTGRIASVGNVLRIVDADLQTFTGTTNDVDDGSNGEENNDKIARIRLTCQSEGLVEILGVENGSGWGEKRVLRSDEYLRARLRPMAAVDDQKNGDTDEIRDWQEVYKVIREDLRIIKLIYQLQLGSEEYPPDTLSRLGNAIQDFPELDDGAVDRGDALLWNLAQEWQSICMTLRQARQAILATERNERMVAAAVASGGPLKLPIHVSDLNPDSRREIQRLDQEFQEVHEVSGMDPILDFQVLIGLPTTNRRFDFLAKLVARERQRLQDIASSSSRRRRS